MLTLAAADFQNPLFWALLVGWIMSVVLHELAHGIVGHLGGDYTIRERGGLTLNPIQYIDPIGSILMPVIFLLMGGVPLPGGVTYIRMDLLRSRAWQSAVSAAGPAMNFLLFLALSLPFHPRFGWIDPTLTWDQWGNGTLFLAALAQLQLVAMVFNLLPIPPLDGFGILAPFLDQQTRFKLSTPPVSTALFFGLFIIVWQVPGVFQNIYRATHWIMLHVGFDESRLEFFGRAYNRVLFGV